MSNFDAMTIFYEILPVMLFLVFEPFSTLIHHCLKLSWSFSFKLYNHLIYTWCYQDGWTVWMLNCDAMINLNEMFFKLMLCLNFIWFLFGMYLKKHCFSWLCIHGICLAWKPYMPWGIHMFRGTYLVLICLGLQSGNANIISYLSELHLKLVGDTTKHFWWCLCTILRFSVVYREQNVSNS